MSYEQTFRHIEREKLILIARALPLADVEKLAEALVSGGVSLMEITFRQDRPDTFRETADAIRMLSERFAGRILPGAGTVLTEEQAQLAADAGAKYIISPNVCPAVIRKTRALGLVSIPGAMTPTECVDAVDAGASFVKLFPVSVGGPALVKAFKAPLAHIPMLVVGGINADNLADYLAAGASGAGTSVLYKTEWIQNGEWDKVTEQAKRCMAIIRGAAA